MSKRPPSGRPSGPAPCRMWGHDFDAAALRQMENACRLPVAVAGALMPDAHMGYGLPIGGVLAARGAVIPYAVGVDIACRMRLTILDMPPAEMRAARGRMTAALEQGTCFGVGGCFRPRKQHAVMDADWGGSPVTARLKDKAWDQLGTSGAGNHFVELVELKLECNALGPPAGCYAALLSHGGSRGVGAAVAEHYSRLAMRAHPELSGDLAHLAWLDVKSAAGREYWAAMELMGRYAAANHALIHEAVVGLTGAVALAHVENHHNFAWREHHGGEELIVHRKGATPAQRGALGIIPGTMATPGFVVRGKGHPGSLHSAAHGAGRKMSRKAALRAFDWASARRFLDAHGVELISGGLDEVPMSYKDIMDVMRAQRDLVEIIGRFDPRLVKMAPQNSKRRF